MKNFPTIALCAAFAAALSGTARAAYSVDEVLNTVDDVTAQALAVAEGIRVPWEVVDTGTPAPMPMTLAHNTDYVIITDYGTGATVSKAGAFSNPAWWTCATSKPAGLPVTVRCASKPAWQSGKTWKCDVMDATAKALTNHRHVRDWADIAVRETVRSAQDVVSQLVGTDRSSAAAVPQPPDPGTIRWGQAAGYLACDGASLETQTATQSNPVRKASGVFGATNVAEFVCEARRAQGVLQAPIAPYSVNCLDPGALGVG